MKGLESVAKARQSLGENGNQAWQRGFMSTPALGCSLCGSGVEEDGAASELIHQGHLMRAEGAHVTRWHS
jgi:hypothetical protein